MNSLRTLLVVLLGLDPDTMAKCERAEVLRFLWQWIAICVATIATYASIAMGVSVLDSADFIYLGLLAALASYLVDRTYIVENIQVRGYLAQHFGRRLNVSGFGYLIVRLGITLALTVCSLAFFLLWLLSPEVDHFYAEEKARQRVEIAKQVEVFKQEEIRIHRAGLTSLPAQQEQVRESVSELEGRMRDAKDAEYSLHDEIQTHQLEWDRQVKGGVGVKYVGEGARALDAKRKKTAAEERLARNRQKQAELAQELKQLKHQLNKLQRRMEQKEPSNLRALAADFRASLPEPQERPRSFAAQLEVVEVILTEKKPLQLLLLCGPVLIISLIKLLPLYTGRVNTGSYPMLRQSQLLSAASRIATQHIALDDRGLPLRVEDQRET